nr:hypothetical protein [Tanacetum cinerariifolium]
MDTTIGQQVAMDEALIPHVQRLRIERSNFRLLLDIKSKESTLQLVYDVLRLCPFFKAFLVTADVPEIYMQEFWVTATVHHHAIRFKMDNKKHIVNLESFRDMLHICPRVHGQSFTKLPFEEEILAFIHFLGHSAAIRTLTDVNINKLYQPWRSFAAIINKCLAGKSSGYDSLRLSQAQILWGLYHKRNVDYAYLMWEDFIYQVEHKNSKKRNEMYYPRFTKVIIHHFMSNDPSIPRRHNVNWHYVRDDYMFSTIKLVSRHQNTQQFGALLPIELTDEEIRNSNAYKEYYAIATGAEPPKPKASVRRTRSSSDTTITPPTAAASPRLTTSEKGKQASKASKAKNEGTGSIPGVLDVPTDEYEEELSWNSTDDEGDDDEGKDGDGDEEDDGDDSEEGYGDNDDEDDDGEEGDNDDDDDQEVVTDDDKDDEKNAKEEGRDDEQEYDEEEYDKETRDEESFDHISKTPKNSNDEGNGDEDFRLNVGGEEGHVKEEEEDELYRDVNINQGRGIQATLEVEDSHVILAPVNPDGSSRRMNEAVKVVVQIQSDHLRDEAQREDDKFLKTVDENMQKIIKEHVKEQVKTSYAVVADLSEMELKKILIEKMEGNKSIQRSDEQRNLYKALRRRDDDADKDEEPSVGPDRGSKRRGEGKEPESASAPSEIATRSTGRRGEGKEPESASAPSEIATRSTGRSTQGSQSRQTSASESAFAEEPMQTTCQMEEPSHPEFHTCVEDQPIVQFSQHPEWFSQQQKPPTPNRDWNKTVPAPHGSIQPWISELAKRSDSRSSFNELMDTPLDFSNFLINRLKVDALTPELLAGPTYELMKR